VCLNFQVCLSLKLIFLFFKHDHLPRQARDKQKGKLTPTGLGAPFSMQKKVSITQPGASTLSGLSWKSSTRPTREEASAR
jgi:hypothetical protein